VRRGGASHVPGVTSNGSAAVRRCPVSAADESLERAETLLSRLEATRAKLEATEDPDQVIEVVQELLELARETEAELNRARQAAETDAADA